jgi:hypothetical protein
MVRFLYRKPNSVLQNRVGFFCQMRERSFFKLKLTQSILKSIMVILYHQDTKTGLYDKSSLMMVKTDIIINERVWIIAIKIEKFYKDIFYPRR